MVNPFGTWDNKFRNFGLPSDTLTRNDLDVPYHRVSTTAITVTALVDTTIDSTYLPANTVQGDLLLVKVISGSSSKTVTFTSPFHAAPVITSGVATSETYVVFRLNLLAGFYTGLQWVEIGRYPASTATNFNYPVTVTTTTPYAVTLVDFNIFVDATAGAKIVTLPIAAATRRILNIKKIDTSVNTVTVTADATGTPDLIDGAATQEMSVPYTSITIQDIATNTWAIL